jgi:hypothetical protein
MALKLYILVGDVEYVVSSSVTAKLKSLVETSEVWIFSEWRSWDSQVEIC